MQPDQLKALRQASGMTQEAFAAAIGMTRVSIGLMERGKAPIERRTALAARYLAEHPEAAGE
ncbi:helix-turn-helix transcriptional regulator [Sphingomonas sp. KR1UV-12]|uniref:Helix-turn-helix transcriptional regulator n=1 Tax=Sphingomonas aurea TaxID=3063994 RepID=A0ABT9EHH3_9SPHN|nr:helix-turn-helix transcriptional regulator [Sphingomonas sp. KR1UV-12]MDP1026411.1 helix-turn-helix transcriptional regulator [Sphingomonas sp. KR1UV-12]